MPKYIIVLRIIHDNDYYMKDDESLTHNFSQSSTTENKFLNECQAEQLCYDDDDGCLYESVDSDLYLLQCRLDNSPLEIVSDIFEGIYSLVNRSDGYLVFTGTLEEIEEKLSVSSYF